MVHQRPCMTREIETWLSVSRVGNNSVVDHRSRRPVLSPLRNCVDRRHVWPHWASRCKPWRWMLKDISILRPIWIEITERHTSHLVWKWLFTPPNLGLLGGYEWHPWPQFSLNSRQSGQPTYMIKIKVKCHVVQKISVVMERRALVILILALLMWLEIRKQHRPSDYGEKFHLVELHILI